MAKLTNLTTEGNDDGFFTTYKYVDKLDGMTMEYLQNTYSQNKAAIYDQVKNNKSITKLRKWNVKTKTIYQQFIDETEDLLNNHQYGDYVDMSEDRETRYIIGYGQGQKLKLIPL